MKGSRFRVQGSRLRLPGYGGQARFRSEGSEFKVLGSRLRERINDMKNRSIKYFDFMHNTRLDLRGESGRQIQKIDLMAVSTVKRAAEGEI